MPVEKALVHENRFGAVKLEIFSFRGAKGEFLKAKIFRIYTDAEGKWKQTSFFSSRELESVAHAAAEANNYMLQHAREGTDADQAAA